jgi:topoisomerase-4 subunit B
MQESAAVANYSNQLISSRFSEVMWLMEQIMWKSFDKRLADFLLEECVLEDSNVLKITHEKIANHMGTAREVVTRMLRYFQSEGYVKLTRGSIEVIDEEDSRSAKFYYENGLINFVEYINEGKAVLHKVINFNGIKQGIEVDIALQYQEGYNENILSFVNNVKTGDGGSHETGFKSGITKAFNDYAKENNVLKGKDTNFEGSDVREGLSAVINLKIPENLLQFEGQTKGKLGTPEARTVTEQITYENMKFFLEENRETALLIVEKASRSKVAREAARKAREAARNGKGKEKKDKILSGKLAKATGKDTAKNELFLVEGDSAGGSAKTGRNRETQAILPLRGKVLNCEKASNNDINNNEELNTLTYAIGAGIGNEFDPTE